QELIELRLKLDKERERENEARDEEGVTLRLEADAEFKEIPEEETVRKAREYALQAQEVLDEADRLRDTVKEREFSENEAALRILEVQINDAIDRDEFSEEETQQEEVIEEIGNDQFR
ncbi:MAG: hypothetical protein AAGI63_02405, partial [Planctomycetota bacterium]